MSKIERCTVGGMLGLLLAAVALAATPPNVVLVMSDDQGWGDVSYNGHPELKTPHLDEMARSGLRFDRFYSTHFNCSPTRASILTGRHPGRYGLYDGEALRAEELTIATAMKAAGYVTGHFGKWHLTGTEGPGAPIPAERAASPAKCGFDEWVSVTNFFDLDPMMARNGVPEQFRGDGSDVVTVEAMKFIRRQTDARRPFLAVVWFGSPHSPYQALESDKTAYRDRPEKVQNYYGEMTALDRSVGRIRQGLRELKVEENTLLWFCSDNGGTFGSASTGNVRGAKGTFWEGGIRVPGLIEWPARIKRTFSTEVPCSTLDIYPTLLAAAGLTAPNRIQPLDGIDLLPLMDRKMSVRTRPIPFWDGTPRHGLYGGKLSEVGLPPGHAVWLDWPYKLHRNPVIHRGYRGSDLLPPVLLYEIERDPNETTDLAALEPDRVARMIAALDTWKASVKRSLAGADYPRR